MEYVVAIQIIQVYQVTVEARSAEEAVEKVEAMHTTGIREAGSLQDVSTDYCEVVG